MLSFLFDHMNREYYEDWSFLLDKSVNSTLPMLVSGLNSILFAINIDNSNLNLATKLNYNKSSQNQLEQSKETLKNSNPVKISPKLNDETPNDMIRNNSFNGNSLAVLNLTNGTDAKNSNLKNGINRKVRKNNVVLDDDDDASFKKTENRSKTTINLLSNPSETNLLQNGEGSYPIIKSKSISELSHSSSINNQFELTNNNNLSTNHQDQEEEDENGSKSLNQNSNQQSLKSDSFNNFDESKLVINSNTNKKSYVNNSNVSDTSEDSTTEKVNFDIYK